MAANLRQVQFINTLLSQVPDLQPIFAEHMQDEGELLPHLFLADVTRFVIDQCKKLEQDPLKSGKAEQNLVRIMSLMDAGLTSDQEDIDPLKMPMTSEEESISNFIGVSFVENLIGHDCLSLEKYLTPALAADLRQFTSG